MAEARSRTYYELFGVSPNCSFEELRAAYRQLARERHPDVAPQRPGLGTMAEINEAWRVLSNEESRRSYDALMQLDARQRPPRPIPHADAPGRPSESSRRQAWAAGVQAQMARLVRLAGRSATQGLLIRNPRGPRQRYETVVDSLVSQLAADVESRVRAARAAGAAPLDLGVAATLVGIRSVSDSLRRRASLHVDDDLLIEAELLDRMWDILAHELPVQLTSALGGNPRVTKAIEDSLRG